MALGAVTFQISRSMLCKKFTARPSPREMEPNRYGDLSRLNKCDGRVDPQPSDALCCADRGRGIVVTDEPWQIGCVATVGGARFAGKRASIEIPKGRKIFRHCIQRWTPRGSGICVDRRVQFVFHPRFQHIFVRGKTRKDGKDGKDLLLLNDGFFCIVTN